MCGNDDVTIRVGEGGCGSSSETLRIERHFGCGLSDSTYTITRESGSGCGHSSTSYEVDEATGRALIDAVNSRREEGLRLRR